MILLGILILTTVIFLLPHDQRTPEPSQEKEAAAPPVLTLSDGITDEAAPGPLQGKAVSEKFVFTLNEVVTELKRPEISTPVKAHKKKLGYHFGIEDATGQGNVRSSNAKIGVNYKMSKNSTVGVEVRRGLHDSQDAAAWGRSVDDENAAQAKYKLLF